MRRAVVAGWMFLVAACAGEPADDGATVLGDAGGPCAEGQSRCFGEELRVCSGGTYLPTASDQCRLTPCSGDACEDLCARAAADRSYIGCEYWPVDLDNAIEVLGPQANGRCRTGVPRDDLEVCWDGSDSAGLCDQGGDCPPGYACRAAPICALDAQGSPFAVVVSNPDAERAATVTLRSADGQEVRAEVAPGAVVALFPQQLGLPDQSLDHSGVQLRAYRLTADRPIIAYQFNPLDNVDVFSNDGSLLIPRHAYDSVYAAVTLPTLTRRPRTNDYNGYVTVVAAEPGVTRVRVTPTAEIRAGARVEALQPGEARDFTLQQFEVLNLEAAAGGDLTGTLVESPEGTPFGVFVGHEATVLSDRRPSPCCADHVEEQLFPVSTWGSNFAIARTQPRGLDNGGGQEPDLLRIVAWNEGTTVTIEPPGSGACGVLGRGDHCDVFISQDTVVRANEPILIAHFLLSTGGDAGDPAMAFAVPFEQFRETYTLLVPEQYDRQYLSVVSPENAPVLLDGEDISDRLTPFGGAFVGGRIPVQPGQRRLECPHGCGVEVYGYSQAVSYLFAGGLDLERITAP